MSQEELEKLLLEAHISQDFDLKTLESQWFQTFCKVTTPNFTVPSPKKLEQMAMENFETIRVSASTKLSDIQSVSVVVDEWKFEDLRGQENFIFQTLTCSATTKLYEQFTCFLDYKFDGEFYSHEILEKCNDLIPDFHSKIVRVLSSGECFKSSVYQCGLDFDMDRSSEVGPKWFTEESTLISHNDDLHTISSECRPWYSLDRGKDVQALALIGPYRQTCISLQFLTVLVEVVDFLRSLETHNWGEYEKYKRGQEFSFCVNDIYQDWITESSIQNFVLNNLKLLDLVESAINACRDQESNRGDHSPNAPFFIWKMMTAKEILNSDPNSTSFQDLKVDHQEIPIFNEFFSVVAPLQDTIDEFLNKPEMIGSVIPFYILLRSKLAEMSKDGAQLLYWKDLAGIINIRLENRLAYVLEDIDYLLGAVLDPRFKMDWVASAGKEKFGVETKVREELKKRLAKNGSDKGSFNDSSTSEPPAKAPKSSRFSSILSSRISNTKNLDVDYEFSVYIGEELSDNESLKPLSFWKENIKRFPCLSSIAGSLFGTPVSLGSPEKVIETFKDFFSFHKRGYSTKETKKLMFMKHNAHFLS